MVMNESDLDSFGALLTAFRKRGNLTQQQLATAIGLHRNTIGRWEQGDVLPTSKGIVFELARCLRLDGQETRHLLEASLTAPAPHWHVPFQRNPFFTGREEILEALHTCISTNQVIALTHSYALHGLGGVGKTQIALEYVYRHALEYSAVFWIGAEEEEQITSSLLHIAEALQLPERKEKDQQRVVTAVLCWLSTHSQWLLIWDNVEDLALLDHFLPSFRQGVVLITTRCQALGTFAHGINLLPMQQEEGMLFLLRRARLLPVEASCETVCQLASSMPEQYTATAELVAAVGGLPLALDQAGAYIEETRCRLPVYLDLFRCRRATLLDQRGERTRDHPTSVAATFRVAIAATAGRHPAIQDFLRVCALLGADAIPEELFLQGGKHLGATLEAVCCDLLEWNRMVGIACAYSLLFRQPEEQTLSIHRLVQAVLLDSLTEKELELWSMRVIKGLNAAFPEIRTMTNYTAWKQGERLLPHTLLCLYRVKEVSEPLELASLAYKAALYLRERGRYGEAEPLYLRTLHVQEQSLGPEHPGVATALNNLALLYCNQGRYGEAEPLYLRALYIKEQSLGPEHLEVARPLHNLALLYYQQGRYGEAEPLFMRALHIKEQHLGPEHPEVTLPLQGLAELYSKQGKYNEAEPLYLRALQIQEQQLESEHPKIAIALNNLAELYYQQGKYNEAEPLYLHALHILEQSLGPEHPYGAIMLNNLADLYCKQGSYNEAEPLYLHALRIKEQQLGSEHPEVSQTLNDLANLTREQSRYAEAESLFQQALSIRESHLGQHHPDTAETLHDLALLRQRQNYRHEAISLAERALQIRSQVLGETHPKTVATRELYTLLIQEQTVTAAPTLEQLRTCLKARGWSLHLKKRHNKPYVYATRKVGKCTQSRYLAPLSNLAACQVAANTLPNAKEW